MLRLSPVAALFLFLLFAGAAHAQGGPPFLTDDPGTPGNKQWEINVGWLGAHNPGSSSYQLPDIDMNYGLGNRIQLKYEVPLAAVTDESNTTRAGVGQSLPGIKWRFYEHHTPGEPKTDENLTFAMSTYPMVSFNNSRSASERGIVPGAPTYWLPIEIAGRFSWLSYDAEVGHWFGNRHVPDRWARGLVLGHEFSDRFELYGEVYNLQDANRINGEPKQRSLSADIGGRQTLDKAGHLRLLFLGGRSLQSVSRNNSQPDWIAYVGLQVLFGPKTAGPATDKEQ